MTNRGLEQLKIDEGLKLTPYICPAGVLTVGYGHAIQPHENKTLNRTISKDEAEKLLIQDVRYAELGARRYFRDFDTFTPARQDALINMVFNLGWSGFGKFRNFMNHISLGNWDVSAGILERSLWRKQVKGRAERIIKAIREG